MSVEFDDNKQIVKQVIERKIQNFVYNTEKYVRDILNAFGFENAAIVKLLVSKIDNAIALKIDNINLYVDMLVESSFENEDTTIEQALINANFNLNNVLSEIISSKTGLPNGVVAISLPLLLGDFF